MSELVIPKHIGIICDGNRRFAHTLGEAIWMGHEHGAEKIEDVLNWCRQIGVKSLTLWLFSTENFSRSKEEVDMIFKIGENFGKKFLEDKRVYENKIKFSFIGDLSLFPENIQTLMRQIKEKTKDHNGINFNVAGGYGGKQEIIDAVKLISKKIESGEIKSEQITKELIEAHMYSSQVPDVDLVIRTSGEKRTSGFLMWKTDYAEYFFSDKYWPEFSKEDLLKAVMDYSNRKRRFGK